MSGSDPDSLLDELLEEALEARRRGEGVSVEALARRHPELAPRLRRLLPVLLAMAGPVQAEPAAAPAPARAGPWRLGRLLGEGGMGRVFEGWREGEDAARGPSVAVKLIHPHLARDPRRRARLLREAELGSRVVDPHVVRTLEAGVIDSGDGAQPYLVLEHVAGQTLRELLDEAGALPERLVRHLALGLARGLRALHGVGAVHRDVKPENVMLTAYEDVKLMDLGVAALAEGAERLSLTGEFVGTMLYAAPEQVAGRPVDARADLFALGLVLEEALTGRRGAGVARAPGGGVAPGLPASVSPFLVEVLESLLRTDPARRLPSAATLVELLEAGEASPWWRERQRAAGCQEAAKEAERASTAPLRGRERELLALEEALERLRAGVGSVVWFEGEAGLGKSRLLRAFGAQAGAPHGPPPTPRIVRVRHVRLGRPVPGLALGLGDALGGGGLGARLAALLGGEGSFAPRLEAVLGGDDPDALSPAALAQALLRLSAALARDAPLVLLVDDLHEATAADVEALLPTVRAAATLPALVVMGSRPLAPGSPARALEDVVGRRPEPLAPLAEAAARQVLEDALGASAAHELPLGVLVDRAEGVPLFLSALARHVLEGGGVRAEQLPATLRDAMAERLAGLPSTDRDLLEMAACAGEIFDPLLVAQAAGLPVLAALRRFAALERDAGLLVSEGDLLRFRPRIAQEVLLAGLTTPLKAACHDALGRALEAQPPPPRGSVAERERALRLVSHFVAGAALERAAPYLPRALEAHLARRARGSLRGLLADVGDVPGLRRLLSGLDLALAFLAISESWGDADAHPEALACASEGILLAVSHGDHELAARLRTSLARNLFSQGLYEAMDAVQQAALADAVASGSARAEALIRNNLAFTLPSLGRIDEALEQGARALTLARQAGDTELEGLVAGNHGGRLAERGRVAEARPFVERALALARAGGEPGRESWALQMLFELQRGSGELEAAALTARRAAALGLDAGDPHKQVRGLTRLGAVLVELGRAAEALEVLDRALAVIGRHEAHSASGAEVLALRAVACLATGGARAVGPDLDRAEALARRTRRTVELARVLLVRATLAAWAGQPSRAREWLSHAAAEGDGAQLRLAPKRALVEGGLAEVADDLDAARQAYVGAAQRCREASWAPGRLLLLPAWGRAEAALGRSEAARTLWAEAVGAGRGMGLLGVAAVAEAHLAALDGDPAAARLALERDLPRLSVRERYEARYVLARALGDAVLAAQADEDARLLQADRPPWAAGAARGRRC